MRATSPIAPACAGSASTISRHCKRESTRTLYRFDVRDAEEYTAGHIAGFRHYPGGQLVQEIDMAAPVRGARIVLADDLSIRADMTASWLAQMGWETYVLDGGYDGALEAGRRSWCRSPIPLTAIGVPMRAPTLRQKRCRPISIGNSAWSSSSGAMAPTDFS